MSTFTNAQYIKDDTATENETVRVTIDGLDYQVPINDLNRHWRQMKKLVDAGQLTIKAAD
tara:strand:- start:99 stop:278 length:180 start_codon:yes stop_codon:yes gene_type:complete